MMFIQLIPWYSSYFDGFETAAVDKVLKVVVTSSTAAASGTPTSSTHVAVVDFALLKHLLPL